MNFIVVWIVLLKLKPNKSKIIQFGDKSLLLILDEPWIFGAVLFLISNLALKYFKSSLAEKMYSTLSESCQVGVASRLK